MDNRRVPINVSVTPSDYSGRSIRLGNTDIREKMQQRMREFEDESRKWRDQFMSQSPMGLGGPSILDRPRMFLNYPEFPELSSSLQPLSSRFNNGFFPSGIAPISQNTQKSFIEEDDNGNKKYKITFDVGDFKPNEIQVRTEGRSLVVKGDREIVAGSSSETKQFNREITLPDFVEPTSVISFLSDGVLTVEAPVQMERLGYSNNAAITNSSTSSSTMRQSPFRETQSPSRSILNSARNTSQSSQFNTLSTNNSNTVAASSSSSSSSQPVSYKFNMSEFRPEDIAITVTDTILKIHAVREESDNRGTGKTYREFKREIGLPFGADVKRLKNSLQSDGTLLIEIPVNGNDNLRPPLSPTGLDKQFSNFSLNDNKTSTTALQSMNNDVQTTHDGKDLRLTFDLNGYKPEDLSIKVIDGNTLRVHAVHIDNTKGNQIHREYTRQYQLPDWVQPEYLRARMSDNGTLTVEIPVPQAQPSKFESFINIQK